MKPKIAILFLCVLIAGFIFISCSGKTESTPAAKTETIADSVASADGTMIQYKVTGQGEPVLVFVHCWECNMTFWDNQVDVFNKNHKVVMLDLAGHGTSGMTREDYTMEAYAQDVAAVVNKVGLDKFILIGHSMGGPVNVEAARILGDRVIALIGVDTYADLDREYPEEQVQQWIGALEADFYNTTMGFVKSMFPEASDSVIVAKISEDMASASPEVGISSMKNMIAQDLPNSVEEINIPFYLINADMYPLDTIAGQKYASEFHFKIMPNAGHFLHMEKPQEFNEMLEATIREITSKTETEH